MNSIKSSILKLLYLGITATALSFCTVTVFKNIYVYQNGLNLQSQLRYKREALKLKELELDLDLGTDIRRSQYTIMVLVFTTILGLLKQSIKEQVKNIDKLEHKKEILKEKRTSDHVLVEILNNDLSQIKQYKRDKGLQKLFFEGIRSEEESKNNNVPVLKYTSLLPQELAKDYIKLQNKIKQNRLIIEEEKNDEKRLELSYNKSQNLKDLEALKNQTAEEKNKTGYAEKLKSAEKISAKYKQESNELRSKIKEHEKTEHSCLKAQKKIEYDINQTLKVNYNIEDLGTNAHQYILKIKDLKKQIPQTTVQIKHIKAQQIESTILMGDYKVLMVLLVIGIMLASITNLLRDSRTSALKNGLKTRNALGRELHVIKKLQTYKQNDAYPRFISSLNRILDLLSEKGKTGLKYLNIFVVFSERVRSSVNIGRVCLLKRLNLLNDIPYSRKRTRYKVHSFLILNRFVVEFKTRY